MSSCVQHTYEQSEKYAFLQENTHKLMFNTNKAKSYNNTVRYVFWQMLGPLRRVSNA